MEAAVIQEHGGIECVQIGDVPEPETGGTEVLLDVRAAALNHLDIWVRNGAKTLEIPKPHVLGSDAAGIVLKAGGQVHGFRPGDEVVVNPGMSCGCCEQCRRGQHSQCESFGLIGLNRSGTFVERVTVPFTTLWPKPADLSFEQAAALPLSYVTAWRMLMTRARLRPGQTVLIHGIGGGVALAALQFVVAAGGEAIVTSSSDAKLAKAQEMGAKYTINYSSADVAAAVKEITHGRGVDIAFDTAGAATWPLDFKVVRRGGSIVICGVTTGARAETNLQALYWNQLNIYGSTMGSNEDFRLMLRTVENTGLVPIVDSVFPLNQARTAMEKMEEGGQFGKIVLKMK